MKILIGTNNENKFGQFREIFEKFWPEAEIFSPGELGIMEDVEEDGESLLENAKKKAEFFAKKSGMIALADDTGLFVDALDGEPGIHAKRWHIGKEHDRNLKLLERLKDIPEEKRTCRYIGVLAVYDPGKKEFWDFEGVTEGWISDEFRGENGFGYDQIFKTKDFGKHFAELSDEERFVLSHRARGARSLLESWRK